MIPSSHILVAPQHFANKQSSADKCEKTTNLCFGWMKKLKRVKYVPAHHPPNILSGCYFIKRVLHTMQHDVYMYWVSPHERTYCTVYSIEEYLMSAHLLFRMSCLLAYQPTRLPANIFHTIKYHIIYKIDEMRLSNAEKYTQSNMEWKEMSAGSRERAKNWNRWKKDEMEKKSALYAWLREHLMKIHCSHHDYMRWVRAFALINPSTFIHIHFSATKSRSLTLFLLCIDLVQNLYTRTAHPK